MSRPRRGGGTKAATRTVTTVLLEHEPSPARVRVERPDETLDRVLAKVAPAPKLAEKPLQRSTPRAEPAPPMLRTARIVAMPPGKIEITFRGAPRSVLADLGEGVERELLASAMKNRDAVLIEWAPDASPVVVGVVQTRIPAELVLKAQKVTIEAEQELTLRSGTAALRLREDGDVEVVGSRIAIASRGLFRLVGRMLRLN